MLALRKIMKGNDAYPPSESLWREILELVYPNKEEKNKEDLLDLQQKLQREVNRFKPSLPEPELARFQHNGFFYYLDPKGRIYEMDDANPLVGNLVGEIKTGNDGVEEIVIKGQTIHKFPHLKVYAKKIHDTTYYIDEKRQAYRGFHPQNKSVYLVGELNAVDKIRFLQQNKV